MTNTERGVCSLVALVIISVGVVTLNAQWQMDTNQKKQNAEIARIEKDIKAIREQQTFDKEGEQADNFEVIKQLGDLQSTLAEVQSSQK